MKTKALIKDLRIQSQSTPLCYDAKLFATAADRLEMLSVMSKKVYAKLKAANEDRASMAAALKYEYGCHGCKHCDCEWDKEPCDSCRQDVNFPKWVWKGETHER